MALRQRAQARRSNNGHRGRKQSFRRVLASDDSGIEPTLRPAFARPEDLAPRFCSAAGHPNFLAVYVQMQVRGHFSTAGYNFHVPPLLSRCFGRPRGETAGSLGLAVSEVLRFSKASNCPPSLRFEDTGCFRWHTATPRAKPSASEASTLSVCRLARCNCVGLIFQLQTSFARLRPVCTDSDAVAPVFVDSRAISAAKLIFLPAGKRRCRSRLVSCRPVAQNQSRNPEKKAAGGPDIDRRQPTSLGRTEAPWRPRLACVGREDRSSQGFNSNSPRRVGPTPII